MPLCTIPLLDTIEAKVTPLQASKSTKAYITGLFLDQARSGKVVDFSRDSIVLAYSAQRISLDISRAQQIADWSLFVLSWFPQSVESYRPVVEDLGRLSYWRCYRLVPEWRVYEELGDTLPVLVRQIASNSR